MFIRAVPCSLCGATEHAMWVCVGTKLTSHWRHSLMCCSMLVLCALQIGMWSCYFSGTVGSFSCWTTLGWLNRSSMIFHVKPCSSGSQCDMLLTRCSTYTLCVDPCRLRLDPCCLSVDPGWFHVDPCWCHVDLCWFHVGLCWLCVDPCWFPVGSV